MKKFLHLLLALPMMTMGKQFTHHLDLHGGMASTVFQNKFEKTYNANPNGVWKPSVGLDFQWLRDGQSGITFGLGVNYAQYGLKFDLKYGPNVKSIVTNERGKLDYIQIPLQIGYHWPLAKIDIYTSLGLAPAFLTAYNYVVTWTDNGARPETFTFIGEESYISPGIYNKFQLFGYAQLGLHYPINDLWGMDFNLQYQYGFLDIENISSIMNGSDFWYSYNFSTPDPQQTSTVSYSEDWSIARLTEYTTKTPHTKLSSFGLNLGIYYSF